MGEIFSPVAVSLIIDEIIGKWGSLASLWWIVKLYYKSSVEDFLKCLSLCDLSLVQNSLVLILYSLYNYKKEIWGKAGVLAEEENIIIQIWIK